MTNQPNKPSIETVLARPTKPDKHTPEPTPPTFVLLHCLSIQHTGAHTPSALDSCKWHGVTGDGVAFDITEFEAQQHIDEGMEVLGGTVTRPFHSFYGSDLSDAIAAAKRAKDG